MKILALASGLVLAVLAPGCVTAIRPYAIENPAVFRSSPLSSVTISVTGDNERDVEVALFVLRRTGVFGAIERGQGARTDLGVNVMEARDSITCGTPQVATVLSLGLMPTSNAHHARLSLEFSGHANEQPVLIEREFVARTKHGLWALFLRAKKEWTRPNWKNDPAGLAFALRESILAHEDELVRLAGKHTI